MPDAYKFIGPLNPEVTRLLTYSRGSGCPNNAASEARQLLGCAAYTKFVLQRELVIFGDRAEAALPSEAILQDTACIGRSLAPLPVSSTPSWMRPSSQPFLINAQAVRLGILVVRNVGAALRHAAAANAGKVRGIKATLADKRARMVEMAKARLRKLFSAPADLTLQRETSTESQRRKLEAEIVQAGRKRFFAYLAMERAKELNGRRRSPARRFIATRPNRT